MRLRRPAPRHSFFLLAVGLSVLSSCQTMVPGNTPPEDHYLNEDFQCKTGILNTETDPRRYLIQEAIRKKVFTPPVPGRPRIVLTGDSTAALFTADLLEQYLPQYAITNRAIPGDTTITMLHRLEADVLSLSPDIVILAIGGNDIILGRCLDEILQNTATLIQRIQEEQPGRPVLITAVPPVMSWEINAITPFYNNHLKKMATGHKQVRFVDLWDILAAKNRPVLAEPYRRSLPDDRVDSVHFNNSGYKRWAEKLGQILEEMGAKRKSIQPDQNES